MKAVVFKGKDRIAIEEVAKPTPRAGEAVIRITTTTICGTDVHIVRGNIRSSPASSLDTNRSASLTTWAPDSRSSTRSASGSSWAPSRRAANASTV